MVIVAGNEDTKKIKGLYLYHFGPSSASQKVRACLEEKGLEWSGKVVMKELGSDWYYTVHPKGLVPALVHDGVTHIESNDILVYLDEAFPDPPLRPKTEEGNQEVQSWLDLESTIQKSMKYVAYAFLLGRAGKLWETDEKLEKVKKHCPENLEFHQPNHEGFSDEVLRLHIEKIHDALEILETRLKSHTWLVGDSLTIADLCWGPDVSHYMSSYNFPLDRYQGIQDWYKRLCDSSKGFQNGILKPKHQLPAIPGLAFKVVKGLKKLFGYTVPCCEQETDTSGWKSVLLMSLLLCACLIFYPKDGISVGGYSVSRLIANVLLAVLWLWSFRSAYRKAHTPSRYIYYSRLHTMKAMLMHKYGAESQMELEDVPRPKVMLPDDILVRVKAASVNPLDTKMKEGYGLKCMSLMRRVLLKDAAYNGQPLPIILGRDFSGVVEQVGADVSRVAPGDEVWGTPFFVQTSGALAEYIVVKEQYISKKPPNLNHVEAASLAYVTMTTWTALANAKLDQQKTAGKRVLILGGTGGIGTFAIQLVKAWGGHVTTTCSTRGIDLVKRLGADQVIDYTKEDFETVLLRDKQKFDAVLDTRGPSSYQACLNVCKRGGYVVTLVSPLLLTIDKYGLLFGLIKGVYDLLSVVVPQKLLYGRNFLYVFVAPKGENLDVVGELVQNKKIVPVVEKVFTLSEANEAFQHVAKGRTHGKVVITVGDK